MSFIDSIVAIFFGWPAIIASIVLAIVGLIRTNYRLLVAAAIIGLPPAWFLSGFPLIQSPVFLLPLFLFGSGYLIYRGQEMWAWLLTIPYFMSIWLLLNAAAS
jgi:hypothetical protein